MTTAAARLRLLTLNPRHHHRHPHSNTTHPPHRPSPLPHRERHAGERTNLRAGHPAAATARLRLCLHVPHLLGTWLPSYARPHEPRPLLLLALRGEAACTPEALAAAAQRVTTRYVKGGASDHRVGLVSQGVLSKGFWEQG